MRTIPLGTFHKRSAARRALYAAAAVTLLAGCSGADPRMPAPPGGAQQSVATQSVRQRAVPVELARSAHPELAALPSIRAKAVHGNPQVHSRVAFPGGGVVWVTDAGANKVFRCSPVSCVAKGSGWNEPQGIAIDASNDVYVADTANSRIVELAPGGAQVAVYNDTGYFPAGVGVAPNGVIGVTNILGTSGGAGNVAFFTPGNFAGPTSTACCMLSRYYFGGFDSAGNFYADGFNSGSSVVVEQIAGASTGGTTETNTGIGNVSFPGGVQVGKTSGVLNVDDQTCPCIDRYALPSYIAGTPITLGSASDPVSFGETANDQYLWAADAGDLAANEYADPTGAAPADTLSGFSEPIGAVVAGTKVAGVKHTEILNQFNTLPNAMQPTNFEIVLAGNLVNSICGPINPPCLDEPLYGPFNPFCPPSQGPNNPCYPTVTYDPTTNTTTVSYSGPTLYDNTGNPGDYHFGLFATPQDNGQQNLTTLRLACYWSYPSAPNSASQCVSINAKDKGKAGGLGVLQPSSSGSAYAEVYASFALSPGGPAVYGTWDDIPYIPAGSLQPDLTFANYGTQPLYPVSSGIILNIAEPTDPLCASNPACPEDMALLGTLNFSGSPPPGYPNSQFVPLTHGPGKVLKPIKGGV